MIIFDKCKYVTEIMRNGLIENESRADAKIFLVAKYLIQETKYKPSVIKKNLKKYSQKYFHGLSEDIIDKEIEKLYNRASKSSVVEVERQGVDNVESNESIQDTEIDFVDAVKYFTPKYINLYENELQKISELDERLQDLAFAFLVVNKFQGYKWTYECNADIYKICHWDIKGNGKSQTTKNEMIHRLVKDGIIRFFCATNPAYKYNKKWIAKTSFTVLINEDNFSEDDKYEKSPVWKTITNYDDVLLYWRLYKGDTSIKLCEECGTPIEITGNSKRFCSNCALNKIRESKKRNKEMVSKIAS